MQSRFLVGDFSHPVQQSNEGIEISFKRSVRSRLDGSSLVAKPPQKVTSIIPSDLI